MKRPSRWLIAVSFAVGMLSIPFILAQAEKAEQEKEGDEIEKRVGMDEVSAQAKKTILKVAGKHKIKEIEEVTKGKRKFYEAAWEVDCEEVEIEIKVAPDGKILDIEVEEADDDKGEDDEDEEEDEEEEDEDEAEEQERTIALNKAPAAVKKTIRAQAGKHKIKEIEEVTQGDQKFYEAEWVVKGEGIEIEIRVNRRGRLLGIEVEVEDDDDGDDDDEDDDDEDDDDEDDDDDD